MPRDSLPPGVHHIGIGMQPRLLGPAIRAAGAQNLLSDDPRLRWLKARVADEAEISGVAKTRGHGGSNDIMKTIQQAPTQEQAVEAVTQHVTRRLARLMMIELDSIEPSQHSPASLGIESMIGSEFRNWIFREFGVDIAFQQLLGEGLTLYRLSRMICEKMTK